MAMRGLWIWSIRFSLLWEFYLLRSGNPVIRSGGEAEPHLGLLLPHQGYSYLTRITPTSPGLLLPHQDYSSLTRVTSASSRVTPAISCCLKMSITPFIVWKWKKRKRHTTLYPFKIWDIAQNQSSKREFRNSYICKKSEKVFILLN